MKNSLSFAELATANLSRCSHWHKNGIGDWSVTDWSNAVTGELGETCNAIKKMRRIEDQIANLNEPGRELQTLAEARAKIGGELADTLIYLDLLAQRLGFDLGAEVKRKFNETSIRYNFPERL